jgi:hypothetical protein
MSISENAIHGLLPHGRSRPTAIGFKSKSITLLPQAKSKDQSDKV